jgi:hypothetical protein
MTGDVDASAPPRDASPPPDHSTERMRRHRQRRRSGMRSIVLDVRDHEIEALIKRGFLAQNAADDLWEIGAPVGRLLDVALK